MRYEAAIFDLDGTLLNTLEDLGGSMNRTLEARGFPTFPIDAYRFMVGRGMTNLARAAVPEGTDEATVLSVRDAMVTDYARNWAVATAPYDGIPQLLSALRARGLKLGVFTNKPDALAQELIRHFFPEGMFANVRGAVAGIPLKPDPTGAFLVTTQLGALPEKVLYFGDTNTDIQTGNAAGMFTVGVTWGFRPESELRENHPNTVISSPLEALELLEEE